MCILALMTAMMFFLLRGASAVTLNLTDGRFVQGDIVKQDAKSVEMNVDGVHMTYYADEIKDIYGKPFGAATQAPAARPKPPAPAEVLQPQPAIKARPAAQPVSAVQAEPAAAVAPVGVSSSGIDPEKKALILKFIDVFGTRQALTNNFEAMVKQIEKEKPDESQKIRARVRIDEIIERLLPIYDRNFSSEDLKSFIAFYGSDEGRKLIGTIPELMKESVQESVKYMEEKFPEVKQ
jgi:hypothetical protein